MDHLQINGWVGLRPSQKGEGMVSVDTWGRREDGKYSMESMLLATGVSSWKHSKSQACFLKVLSADGFQVQESRPHRTVLWAVFKNSW